jgi:hypothetical protein
MENPQVTEEIKEKILVAGGNSTPTVTSEASDDSAASEDVLDTDS